MIHSKKSPLKFGFTLSPYLNSVVLKNLYPSEKYEKYEK